MQSLCTLRSHRRRWTWATLATKRTLLLTWAGLPPAGSHQLCLAHVAVGTCVSSHAPRTDPYMRLSRIRLPPRVSDGKANARPRMQDGRFREPGVCELRHPCPREPILLAATPQRAPPEVGDVMSEHVKCATVGRHRVIVEVAADHPAQPFPLRGDRPMHEPPQCLLDLLQLCPHAVRPGLPSDLEFARAGLAAYEGEAQEVEGSRPAEPAQLAALCRVASELDQPGLLGMQRQPKLSQPLAHLVQEAPGVVFVLEADDEVVGIPHDDHVAREPVPSVYGPEVETVVQVDVGKQR